MSQTIKINAKLKAYTKGFIPSKVSQLINDSDFITEAPNDDRYYVRKNREWVEDKQHIITLVDENPGLNLVKVPDRDEYKLSIRQAILENDDDKELEPDTTYYRKEKAPEIFLSSGTAFSSGDNEFVDITEYNLLYTGGNSKTTIYDIKTKPMNANY